MMSELNQLHNRLLLRQHTNKQPMFKGLRESAVLLPIYPSPEGLKIIMIKRAAHLRHHPKQIGCRSFSSTKNPF